MLSIMDAFEVFVEINIGKKAGKGTSRSPKVLSTVAAEDLLLDSQQFKLKDERLVRADGA